MILILFLILGILFLSLTGNSELLAIRQNGHLSVVNDFNLVFNSRYLV